VDDISSDSATARLSFALPMMALSYDGPPTLMAPTMAVSMSNGAITKIILSAQFIDWFINYVVTFSPKRVSRLRIMQRQYTDYVG